MARAALQGNTCMQDHNQGDKPEMLKVCIKCLFEISILFTQFPEPY